MRKSDWSSDVCSSDLYTLVTSSGRHPASSSQSSASCGLKCRLAGPTVRRLKGTAMARSKNNARPPDTEMGTLFVSPKKSETRSEERSVGKEGVSTCRSRWSPSHSKKKKQKEP